MSEDPATIAEEKTPAVPEEGVEPLNGPSSDDLEADDSSSSFDVVKGEDGPEIIGAGGLNETAAPAIEPDEIQVEPDPVAPELPTTIRETRE